jgi:hypothetical protein
MREIKTPKFKPEDRMSNLYKTTFEDGSVHYGRINASKNYSPKTYISDWYSHWKHNTNNPLRQSMITDFEKKVAAERATLKCEIVFFGSTEDCRKMRDKLIRETNKCMNSKSSLTDTMGRMAKSIIQIKKEYVKTITSAVDGTKIYFIDMEYGFRRALKDNMITNKKHPLNPNFVQISGFEIERI